MTKLLTLFARRSRRFYLWLLVFGLVNSAAYSTLLFVINSYITDQPTLTLLSQQALLYVAVVLGAVFSSRLFQAYMIRMTNEQLTEFEIDVLQKISTASFEGFEKLGNERVYTAITDTRTISGFPASFIGALNAAIIVACSLVYIVWISPVGGACVLATMLLLFLFYMYKNRRVEGELNQLRNLQNKYYRYLADLVYGFKEIKMSLTRNENLFQHYLKHNRLTTKQLSIKTANSYATNEQIGSFSWYLLIFIILFVMTGLLETRQKIGLVVVILHIIGPVSGVIMFLPIYTNAKIALERLEQFGSDADEQLTPEEKVLTHMGDEFQSLVFEQVTYEYFDKNGDSTFQFGPIDLNIQRGDQIFLTGGNGSGKSTFINLLTGLYRPCSGTIYLNGQPLTNDQYPMYRNLVSVVFTNPYLFDENYDGFDLSHTNGELRGFIDLMNMQEVIRQRDGAYQLLKDLSKGQQKRLALIQNLLEKRQLLVLDEWAAEQDPVFRKRFYEGILPGLRTMGKTLIAATHDDRYFDCADRIVTFERGKLVADRQREYVEPVN